ncbi:MULTISPECIES: FecCD family ABC transporter permease [Protofrankia]|uniref:FecCD family ABC transporter permease n=1 Tax=Protofrankia TaxID=2994361 RepID=UPI0001C52C7B|nr:MULTISPECIES: iron chelate uptake ABC transporter family permease subunit [Protofrankia]
MHPARRPVLLGASLCVLALLCALSIAIGSRPVPLDQVLRVLIHRDDGDVEAIVWGLRVPRTLLGLLVGAALGLAGTIMQTLTRNPLADPGLLGVSAGATLAVVLSVSAFGLTSLYGYIWFAFAGALAASVLVYLLGAAGRSGPTPVKLALAGVGVTALLGSLTSAIALTSPEALNRYRYWSAGSIAGRDGTLVAQAAPFVLTGVVLALRLAPGLNSLALGDDVAAALGRRVGLIRLQGAVAVTVLTGGAVAVAGPLVFIGLVVPHATRMIAGADHRWLLPTSMVLASCLILAADVVGRVVARPQEINVGIIVAFLGAPFFVMLVRRRRLAEL